ncbi:DUF4232 domain-containing protein [Sanguibacter gelidistatuariae]|uniref:DUF4232 domain-containing protein n=1 Tax=Sanguibacter gelidistatuariae TaxID=1814289 RepID=UPI0011139237|nr:DUF4232 domain-containing protein [Sanguibacter gelidistatuariae]
MPSRSMSSPPARPRSGRRLRATFALSVAVLAIGGCTATGTAAGTGTATGTESATPPTAVTAAPSSVPGSAELDLAPGWDEQGDGEILPDADLTPGDLAGMLRLQATATSTSTSCRPDTVALSLTFADAAMGHRYGVLEVVNTSSVACSVQGYPWIGARGAWGSSFQLAAEQRDPIDQAATQDQVMLAPGASAVANVEWTGELAGAESEPISLLVLQLTSDGEATGHPVSAESAGIGVPDTGIDIGMMTTVRIGPLRAESAED